MNESDFEKTKSPEQEKEERVRSALSQIYESPDSASHDAFAKEIVSANKEHKEWRDYRLWHIIIGSSSPKEEFDTPDGEIESFFESLIAKHLPEEDLLL